MIHISSRGLRTFSNAMLRICITLLVVIGWILGQLIAVILLGNNSSLN